MNNLKKPKFEAGVIMIDVFSGIMRVVPINSSKDEGNIVAGMAVALNKMGG